MSVGPSVCQSIGTRSSKNGKTSVFGTFWAAMLCYTVLCYAFTHSGNFSFFFFFLGSGPKGPMSCRTQGGILRRPSFRPSVRPPPIDHQCLRLALPDLNLALQAANQPPMPQNCPPDLKSALQTFNQPSKHETSPPNLKSALRALIMPSSPQICLQWPISAI